MKKFLFIFSISLYFFSFSMEKVIENQIAIFSNNSDQPIFLDSSAIQYSPFLKAFFESRKEFKAEDIKINLPYEQLKNSLNLINLFLESNKDSSKEVILTNLLQQLSLQDLINTYFVADYFRIIELEESLGSLFNKPEFIEQLAQLDKEQLQALEFIKTNNFLLSQTPEPLLKNVDSIYCSPDGTKYFIGFIDHTGQLFNSDNITIGNILEHINSVKWSPDSSRYFVDLFNSSQLFNNNGNLIENELQDVAFIGWSPDGSKYLIKFDDDTVQLYDKESNPIGGRLHDILSISWAPNSLGYFIINQDFSGQLYDSLGNPKTAPISNVISVYWKPDSSLFFISKRNIIQTYDIEGNYLEDLPNISTIKISPDNSRTFIIFDDQNGQLFDNSFNTIGNIISDVLYISWAPNSSRYFLKSQNKGQIFDKDGNPKGDLLNDIFSIYWSPDSSKYLIRFNDFTSRLFDNNGNLLLDFPIASAWMSNNALALIDTNNNLYINELKFLVKKVADGYQIYRAKNKLPVGFPIQNKPLWLDTNTFKIKKDEYYSYQELSLPDLVNTMALRTA